MVKLKHEDADKTVYSFRGPKSHRRVEIIIKNKDYWTRSDRYLTLKMDDLNEVVEYSEKYYGPVTFWTEYER